MNTYYDLLQILPEATKGEIQVAYEQQYNHWRHLVTHHDPDTVNRANQVLRQLEQAHATLADPAKREAYDAGIGLHGSVGGIADPEAKSTEIPFTPPLAQASEKRDDANKGQRMDAWMCSKCYTANPVGTRFCKQCGQALGRECPKCGTLLEMNALHCSSCGVNIKNWLQEQERQRQQAQQLLVREVKGVLNQVDSLVKQNRYGSAIDSLSVFEGLGKPKKNQSPKYGKSHPEWPQAKTLFEAAKLVRNKQIGRMVLIAVIGYACVSALIGFISAIIYGISMESWSAFGQALLIAFGAVIASMVVAAIGVVGYSYLLGGRNSTAIEYTLALLSPIGLALAIGLGLAFIWLILGIAVAVIVLMVFAGMAGGG